MLGIATVCVSAPLQSVDSQTEAFVLYAAFIFVPICRNVKKSLESGSVTVNNKLDYLSMSCTS